jgi:hypothetical protein
MRYYRRQKWARNIYFGMNKAQNLIRKFEDDGQFNSALRILEIPKLYTSKKIRELLIQKQIHIIETGIQILPENVKRGKKAWERKNKKQLFHLLTMHFSLMQDLVPRQKCRKSKVFLILYDVRRILQETCSSSKIVSNLSKLLYTQSIKFNIKSCMLFGKSIQNLPFFSWCIWLRARLVLSSFFHYPVTSYGLSYHGCEPRKVFSSRITNQKIYN